jgi:two-component system CheB/CheR fusion protein
MAKARRPLAATTHAVQTAVRYGPRNTPAAALPHCRTIPAMPSAAPPACVLLVDDDDTVVAAMQMLLRVSGYRVHASDSGAAALALVVAGLRPDALVVDYTLGVGGPNGIELLRSLRARLGRDVPAIITSGDVSGALDAAVAQLPCARLLVKPFDPKAFVEQVDGLFGPT